MIAETLLLSVVVVVVTVVVSVEVVDVVDVVEVVAVVVVVEVVVVVVVDSVVVEAAVDVVVVDVVVVVVAVVEVVAAEVEAVVVASPMTVTSIVALTSGLFRLFTVIVHFPGARATTQPSLSTTATSSLLLDHSSRRSVAVAGSIVTLAESFPSPTVIINSVLLRRIPVTFFESVTVSFISALTVGSTALFTVIVQEPSFLPMTQPSLSTTAMLSSLLDQISRWSVAVRGNIVTLAESVPCPTSTVHSVRLRRISETLSGSRGVVVVAVVVEDTVVAAGAAVVDVVVVVGAAVLVVVVVVGCAVVALAVVDVRVVVVVVGLAVDAVVVEVCFEADVEVVEVVAAVVVVVEVVDAAVVVVSVGCPPERKVFSSISPPVER